MSLQIYRNRGLLEHLAGGDTRSPDADIEERPMRSMSDEDS